MEVGQKVNVQLGNPFDTNGAWLVEAIVIEDVSKQPQAVHGHLISSKPDWFTILLPEGKIGCYATKNRKRYGLKYKDCDMYCTNAVPKPYQEAIARQFAPMAERENIKVLENTKGFTSFSESRLY